MIQEKIRGKDNVNHLTENYSDRLIKHHDLEEIVKTIRRQSPKMGPVKEQFVKKETGRKHPLVQSCDLKVYSLPCFNPN